MPTEAIGARNLPSLRAEHVCGNDCWRGHGRCGKGGDAPLRQASCQTSTSSLGRMTAATSAVELLPDGWRHFVSHGRGHGAG